MTQVYLTTNLPDLSQRHAPVEQVGQLLSTCGTPAYIHLQLEVSRRMYGQDGIPTLVVNDGDSDKYSAGRLKELCEEYEADFLAKPYVGHGLGDLRAFRLGLEWANGLGLTILAKFSRRFLALRHWRHELMALAGMNMHACCFGRFHEDNRHGLFRTDAIAVRVQKWFHSTRVQETFAEAVDNQRRVNVENIFAALMPTLGGYEPWALLGRDFYRPCLTAVQWRGVLPCVYADYAREWGLPYTELDFTQEGGGGVLVQHEHPELTPEAKEASQQFKEILDAENVIRAREWEFKQRVETQGDINEHLVFIRQLAANCETAAEFGVRSGNSTVALLCAGLKKLTSYDLLIHPEAANLTALAGQTEFHLVAGSSLEVKMEPVDLLMIDSLHTYAQLKKELVLHSGKAKKFIVIHDTEEFGKKGEDGKEPGLEEAIDELVEDGGWCIKNRFVHNHGLTVLERLSPVKNGRSWPERLGFAAGVRQALGI